MLLIISFKPRNSKNIIIMLFALPGIKKKRNSPGVPLRGLGMLKGITYLSKIIQKMLEKTFFEEHNHYIHLIERYFKPPGRNVYIMIKSMDKSKTALISKKIRLFQMCLLESVSLPFHFFSV